MAKGALKTSIAAAALLAAAARAQPALPGYADSKPSSTTIVEPEESLRDAVGAIPLPAAAPPRPSAVLAMAQLRNRDAMPYLTDLLLRRKASPHERAAAALAIGRIDHPGADFVLSLGLNDPSSEVRHSSALALGRHPSKKTVKQLARVLHTDRNWRVRYAAAIALGRSSESLASYALLAAAASDSDERVRIRAEQAWRALNAAKSALPK